MRESHLTDEQLDRLRADVGTQPAWVSHLDVCADCQTRFHQWRRSRPAPDPALAQALVARRAAALSRGRAKGHAHWHYAALAVTLAGVGISLWMLLSSPAPRATAIAQHEPAEAVPDVYADLDFYLWLSKQGTEEQGEANSS